MNKTININLGGFFFHIDEIAFQKLKRYLEAISKSLNDDPQGKNEIIADIEARISELLSERIKDERQVVNENDIEEIIKIMGQPEDYAEVEEGYINNSYSYKKSTTSKKLFRDGNDKFLGGVCAGIGHYIGIDAIWVRLAFIALAFSGFGIVTYIILWILLPEAQTTVEKLQMEGEPVNIDNIEKKIREEFVYYSEKVKEGASELSEKISSADYEKIRKQTTSGFQDFLDTIGKIFISLFKIIGKFIGILLMITSAVILIALLVGGFSIGSFEILDLGNNFVSYPPFFYDSLLPTWLLTLFLIIALAVPFLILFVLGLRIISSSIKRFSKPTSLTLLGIWIIALLGLAFSGIEFASSNAYRGNIITKTNLPFITKDTIIIKVLNDNNILYQHKLRRRSKHEIVNLNDNEKLYSSSIAIDVEKSDTNKTYIEIRKVSEGRNRKIAKSNAQKIDYSFTYDSKNLLLNSFFLSDINHKYKDEDVYITLYIPENITVFFTNNTKHFLSRIENTEDMYDYDMANHYFTMTSDGFMCIDCKKEKDAEKK